MLDILLRIIYVKIQINPINMILLLTTLSALNWLIRLMNYVKKQLHDTIGSIVLATLIRMNNEIQEQNWKIL